MFIKNNQKKYKKSWWSIIKFAILQVKSSFIIWILLCLSILMFIGFSFIFFNNKINQIKLIINFHYSVLFFINIFLILFILLIVIKIFSQEFTNGTYLLILSKPYSRFHIFMLKLIAIWILIFLFISLNILLLYIIGFIANFLIKTKKYFDLYNKLVFKLFLFSLMISFFSSSGIIFISSFLNSQLMLLIVIIFCSCFLLGGLPYSLFTNIVNNIDLTFENIKQNYNIKNIKNILLFHKKIKENNIKYPNITKEIYNFYMNMSLLEINDIKSNENNIKLKVKRLNFYKNKFNLIEEKKILNLKGENIQNWKGYFNGQEINQIIQNNTFYNKTTNINMSLVNKYSFKTLQKLSQNNIFHKEIMSLVKSYENINTSIYYNLRLFDFNSLLLFDQEQTNFYIYNNNDDNNNKTNLVINNDIDPIEIYQFFVQQENGVDLLTYTINDQNFKKIFKNYFENIILFIIQELESNIIHKVYEYKIIKLNKLQYNKNYQKYQSLINIYNIITKLNIIEHWNQIWSSSLPNLPYEFSLLEFSNIDFENQKNLLISYEDFPLLLNNNKIIINYTMFLNIHWIKYTYICIAILWIILTAWILEYKNIL